MPWNRQIACLLATPLLLAPLAARPAPLEDENIIVNVPHDFQVGKQNQQGPMIIAEYVPHGETVQAWSRMITLQVFRNLKHFDPAKFGGGLRQSWTSACPGAEVQDLKEGQENGYPFSLWLFTCPLNPATGKPENMFGKFIGGNDALYSVQYAYRSGLTKEVIPPTMTYLGGIQVCDTRLPDRPCPTVTP
ncbi:hypothetical protein [Phenylobacterium sp.]|uniref:hypothetical protein n=1 Tax=Phenylobacterium sp. TaxID=1871053 RepID=UPI002BE673D5|nr:hypothetical protein [Phenylobacterium sp.]HLZ74403.1 hypothetical protein [Phenylobacterium sp.]